MDRPQVRSKGPHGTRPDVSSPASNRSLSPTTPTSGGETPRGIALHVPAPDSNWRDDATRLGVSTLLFPLSKLQRPLVDELHDSGYVVAASLIEGPGEIRRLLELDVDMSASNAPEYARRLLVGKDEFTRKYPGFAAETRGPLVDTR